MALLNKTKRRKVRARKAKGILPRQWRGVGFFLALIAMLAVSVCAVGYVVFFRSVFAQDIMPNLRNAIVFEEPNPPSPGHLEEEIESLPRKLPLVAIIIDDMGYHLGIGNELLEQEMELSYSFLPYAPYTRELAGKANSAGKAVLLHLPLEPKGQHWQPGPGTIYLSDSQAEMRQKFKNDFAEVPFAEGVNNHMGSLFTEDSTAMDLILREVKKQGLFFVDSITSAGSVGFSLSQALMITSGRRHVFLDNSLEETAICEQLAKLVESAEKRGQAIGIAHPHRETLQAISNCIDQYKERVAFVSIREVLQ